MSLPFHPLTLSDKEIVQQRVFPTERRNCDLCFMNLLSWRFLYGTEVADWNGWLFLRFKADGHPAYLAPVGGEDLREALALIREDAARLGHPFLMLGVCENALGQIHAAMPGHFYATADRSYADYIYSREKMATFAGKKLQSKRNFANRFTARYPGYEVSPLTRGDIAECSALAGEWAERKETEAGENSRAYENEARSIRTVFDNWEALGGRGLVLRAEGRTVAFTYGAPINHDTFDVCVEKADTRYEGAFAMISREFACSLPEQYVFLNREEDLGVEGLRRSKLSYHPDHLLQKHTVMAKHPFAKQ